MKFFNFFDLLIETLLEPTLSDVKFSKKPDLLSSSYILYFFDIIFEFALLLAEENIFRLATFKGKGFASNKYPFPYIQNLNISVARNVSIYKQLKLIIFETKMKQRTIYFILFSRLFRYSLYLQITSRSKIYINIIPNINIINHFKI